LLPVAREPALTAAYRVLRRHLALKQRVSPRRHQLRAALHLAFPALHPLIQDLTQPTSWRFLQGKPPPESLIRQGRRGFLAQGQPRRCWGQWRPATWQPISDLATERRGLKAPYHLDEVERKALAQALTDALAKQPMGLTQAIG
jgi:hypothetical protein